MRTIEEFGAVLFALSEARREAENASRPFAPHAINFPPQS
jgi:hypothetical protein